MTPAYAASELGRTSRELAEAVKLLPKCVSEFDQRMCLARIERLRVVRDAAFADYRKATGDAA